MLIAIITAGLCPQRATAAQRLGAASKARTVSVPRAHGAIINGTVATGPGPLALVVTDAAQCSGTVIASNVVLTAAHCVYDFDTGLLLPASSFIVQTGAVTTAAPTGVYRRVSRVVAHTWLPAKGYGDLALLQLAEPVATGVMPLAGASDLNLLTPGTGALAEGWGIYEPGGTQASLDLRLGGLVVQSRSYCATAAQPLGVLFDASASFCAVDPDFVVSTCHGDSGGPLVAMRSDQSVAQIGITSYGAEACPTDSPSFFTRIDTFAGWIKSWVAELAPPSTPLTPTPSPPTADSVPAAPPTAPAPAPAAPTPSRFEGYSKHFGFIGVALDADGVHANWVRVGLQLRCGKGRRLYVNNVFTAPRAAAWPLSAGTPLHATLRPPARRLVRRQTDWVALRRRSDGLIGSVAISAHARSRKLGHCERSVRNVRLTPVRR